MLALYQLLQPREALGTAETPSQEGSYCKRLQQRARWMLLQLFRSKPELCSYVVGLCLFFFLTKFLFLQGSITVPHLWLPQLKDGHISKTGGETSEEC